MARFKRLGLAAGLCLALTGCAGAAKIEAEPQLRKVECRRYSDAELAQARAELEKYEAQVPMLAAIVDDDGNLRAAVCKKGKPPKNSG